jgi:acyl-coenzyme A thioesterase PaaI-like protein
LSTTICPKVLYRISADDETGREIEENTPDEGEIVMPPTNDMAKPENWVHYT